MKEKKQRLATAPPNKTLKTTATTITTTIGSNSTPTTSAATILPIHMTNFSSDLGNSGGSSSSDISSKAFSHSVNDDCISDNEIKSNNGNGSTSNDMMKKKENEEDGNDKVSLVDDEVANGASYTSL